MKKFFDRYLFSRMSLQISFSVAAILVLSLLLTFINNAVTESEKNSFYSRMSWGFRQLADGGSVTQTLEDLDEIKAPKSNISIVVILALGSWIIGMILCGFVTGAIVNAFDGRKDKIRSGKTRYKFKNHGLVLGWDYQGAAVVQNLLSRKEVNEVLIVSETPAEDISKTLSKTLSDAAMSRIYIYNCSVNINDNIEKLQAELARVIVILDEQNNLHKDGETLYTEQLLQKYVRSKIQNGDIKNFTNLPIKLYVHIEDYTLYTHARAKQNGFVEDEIFDIELCNFYESWAWKCWSKIESADKPDSDIANKYLPLRYKKDSKQVELFVIGSDSMAQAFISYALPLLNYGENNKHCRITMFDSTGDGDIYLPKKQLVDSLPEVTIEYRQCNGDSDEANEIMCDAAMRSDTSVTVLIAIPEADAAIKAYAALSHQLRRQHISVLVRQSTDQTNCIARDLLQNSIDGAELRYFGMTDILPWLDPSRDEYGKNINYSYDIISSIVEKNPLPQDAEPEIFLHILEQALERPYGEAEAAQAAQSWDGIKRWKRWSSISASDSFKEKAYAFPDCTSDAQMCVAFLRSEHNRWWTERLLEGWVYAEQKDTELFLHPLMIEFEKLAPQNQALDLLSILAMKYSGLLK